MNLQHVQSELLALSTEEKTQAIQILTASLEGTWINIQKLPAVPDSDAFIRETGIAVWFLVHRRNQGAKDADLLAEYPDLTATDLANAWLYTQLYAAEIQTAIQRNLAEQQPDTDDERKEDVINDLKQAWQDTKAGNTIPLSQMWEGIDV